MTPTEEPTIPPTDVPTETPTATPTEVPTGAPTATPTKVPTETPTAVPTEVPTEAPTATPTSIPTEVPTAALTDPPTEPPADPPTEAPSEDPTETPTTPPTEVPTEVPTEAPTAPPTSTPAPVTPAPTPFPQEYISIAGRKIWDDQDNAKALRPDAVTVRLTRNGTVIKELTVTADNGWQYSFDDLPVYDAQGKRYTYALSEQPIIGYYASMDGYDLINRLIPDKPLPSDVPFPDDLTEDELTWELYLPNHSAPPYGNLLKTGLEIPAYPYVFAGIGCVALVAWCATKQKKRKK